MIPKNITENMYARAKAISDAQGSLKGSIRFGRGNVYGYLGEEAFHSHFPSAIKENTFDYDFVFENGISVDVKSKMCATPPKDFYEGSVTYAKVTQKCDIYFFCRIDKDTRRAWLCGWEYSKDYLKNAYVKKKGDKDPSNGNVCKRTCWNMLYSDMRDVNSLNDII